MNDIFRRSSCGQHCRHIFSKNNSILGILCVFPSISHEQVRSFSKSKSFQHFPDIIKSTNSPFNHFIAPFISKLRSFQKLLKNICSQNQINIYFVAINFSVKIIFLTVSSFIFRRLGDNIRLSVIVDICFLAK